MHSAADIILFIGYVALCTGYAMIAVAHILDKLP
jgi:hypothetical protein